MRGMKAVSCTISIDQAALLDRCLGEVDFALELISLFLDAAPPLMEHLTDALCVADFEKARRNAHSLRGIAMNVEASTLAQALAALEESLHTGPPDVARLRSIYFGTLSALWECSQTLDKSDVAAVIPK